MSRKLMVEVRPSESFTSIRKRCSPDGTSASGMSIPVCCMKGLTRGVKRRSCRASHGSDPTAVTTALLGDLAPALAARSPGARATRAAAATTTTSEAAATSAAAATTAAAATSEPAATSAAAATTAAAPRDLQGAAKAFPIEKMERGETDVGHFFFAKNEALIGRGIVRLRDISSGHHGCGCATHQRKPQSGGTQRHQDGGFGCALLLRSLLHSWHGRILRKSRCETSRCVISARVRGHCHQRLAARGGGGMPPPSPYLSQCAYIPTVPCVRCCAKPERPSGPAATPRWAERSPACGSPQCSPISGITLSLLGIWIHAGKG